VDVVALNDSLDDGSSYCPESPVNRAQMAVFLVRAFGL